MKLTVTEKRKLAHALHAAALAIVRVWNVELEIKARIGHEINFPAVGDFVTDLAFAMDETDPLPGTPGGPSIKSVLTGFTEP